AMSFFFQAEDGIRDLIVTGVQTCALPIYVLRRDVVHVPAHLSPELAAGAVARLAGPGLQKQPEPGEGKFRVDRHQTSGKPQRGVHREPVLEGVLQDEMLHREGLLQERREGDLPETPAHLGRLEDLLRAANVLAEREDLL